MVTTLTSKQEARKTRDKSGVNEKIATVKTGLDDRDVAYYNGMQAYVANQLSVKANTTYVDDRDVAYYDSMQVYVSVKTNKSYVDSRDVDYYNAMQAYVANQVSVKANTSYVDSRDVDYYNANISYANSKLAKTGDAMNGNINYQASNQGPVLKGADGSTWRINVGNTGALNTVRT